MSHAYLSCQPPVHGGHGVEKVAETRQEGEGRLGASQAERGLPSTAAEAGEAGDGLRAWGAGVGVTQR